MSERREHLLPPRRRNWKRGTPQIGVFLRTADGSTIEMVHDSASPDEVALVSLLLRGLGKAPADFVTALRETWARIQREKSTG